MTTAIEYALMAGDSYISSRREINQFPMPEGWTKVVNPDSYFNDPTSGFEASATTQSAFMLGGSDTVYASSDNATNDSDWGIAA